ncbi:ATP-grasp domain-containing protein [Aliikangiella sp. IMCC44653]
MTAFEGIPVSSKNTPLGNCVNLVVIVGARAAAIDAALELGFKVLVVADKKSAYRNSQVELINANLALDYQQIKSAVTNLLTVPPIAIIAVTEQGVLPAAKLRHEFHLSGQSVASATDALFKSKMKARFEQFNLPCVVTLPISSLTMAKSVASKIGWPLIVKGLASSGSRGVFKVTSMAALEQAVKQTLAMPELGGVALEPFIDARECSVEVIVQNGQVVFENITDYLEPGHTNLLPADFRPAFCQSLSDLVNKVIAAFEFDSGILHIEFYYTHDQILIGEVNARAPGGGLMNLISQAYGINSWQFLINAQVGDQASQPNAEPKPKPKPTKYMANWIIHPGEGTVLNISGKRAVKNHPSTQSFKLKLHVGDKVKPRAGTGSSVGELVLSAECPRELKKAMSWCRATLKIELATYS